MQWLDRRFLFHIHVHATDALPISEGGGAAGPVCATEALLVLLVVWLSVLLPRLGEGGGADERPPRNGERAGDQRNRWSPRCRQEAELLPPVKPLAENRRLHWDRDHLLLTMARCERAGRRMGREPHLGELGHLHVELGCGRRFLLCDGDDGEHSVLACTRAPASPTFGGGVSLSLALSPHPHLPASQLSVREQTTVGYGDMPTLSQRMRVFTLFFGSIGVVFVAASINVIADWFAEQGRRKFIKRQRVLLREAHVVAERVRNGDMLGGAPGSERDSLRKSKDLDEAEGKDLGEAEGKVLGEAEGKSEPETVAAQAVLVGSKLPPIENPPSASDGSNGGANGLPHQPAWNTPPAVASPPAMASPPPSPPVAPHPQDGYERGAPPPGKGGEGSSNTSNSSSSSGEGAKGSEAARKLTPSCQFDPGMVLRVLKALRLTGFFILLCILLGEVSHPPGARRCSPSTPPSRWPSLPCSHPTCSPPTLLSTLPALHPPAGPLYPSSHFRARLLASNAFSLPSFFRSHWPLAPRDLTALTALTATPHPHCSPSLLTLTPSLSPLALPRSKTTSSVASSVLAGDAGGPTVATRGSSRPMATITAGRGSTSCTTL